MKIVIQRDKCIGAMNCIGIAPRSFALDKDKKVLLLDPAAHDEATLFEAVESCPTEAIHVFDDAGKRLYP